MTARRRGRRPVVFALLLTLLAGGLQLAGVSSARADTTPTILGADWLGSQGVNACSMTGTWDSTSCGDHTLANTAPVGSAWQCVELPQRLYKAEGWYTGVFPGVSYAYQIYNQAMAGNLSNMTAQANGSITSIAPGDMIVHDYNHTDSIDGDNAGHVNVVDYIDSAGVHVVEQNYSNTAHRAVYTLSGSSGSYTLGRTLNNGHGHSLAILGIVHSSLNTLGSGSGGSGVPWNFENLDGDPGSLGGHDYNLGQTPAEVNFGGTLQVFYSDASEGYMRHAWADSSGWHFDVLDGAGGSSGRITGNVGGFPSVVVYNSTLQLFYYDYSNHALRHAWSSDGTTWSFDTLDGTTSSYTGHSSGDVGRTPSAVVDGTYLQLFYLDSTNGDLRHAFSSNGTSWSFESLDGSSTSVSGYSANLGSDPTAVSYSGTLQVFYYDSTTGNLRHAWSNSTGWHFENLDGDTGSVGHLNADLGYNPMAVVYGTTLQVFYYDSTNGNLRHAWSDSTGWHFENFDGDSGSIGKHTGNLGLTPNATVLSTSSSTTLQVFYYDATNGNLWHAYSDAIGWHFEVLDGAGGVPGTRVNADVGSDPVAIQFGTIVELFYLDNSNGNLRHSWSQ